MSNCSVVNTTAITCSTPNLMTTSLTQLDYALLFDDAPPTNQTLVPISVFSNPSNFRLEGSQEVTSGTATLIRIVVRLIASTLTLFVIMCSISTQGDNLDSVETREIQVTVGGEECAETPSESRRSEVICSAPSEPPGGVNSAIIQVSDY